MSAQRLSDRTVARLSRRSRLPLVAGWSHGTYWHGAVTAEHVHVIVNVKSGEWHPVLDPTHYTRCAELFPTVPTGKATP